MSQAVNDGSGEKCSNPKCILKLELIVFVDGLKVGH